MLAGVREAPCRQLRMSCKVENELFSDPDFRADPHCILDYLRFASSITVFPETVLASKWTVLDQYI